MTTQNRLTQCLYKPTDNSTLCIFRILFGLLMVFYVITSFTPDIIRKEYVYPKTFFSFELFHLLKLKPLPENLMIGTFVIRIIAAFFVAIGFFTRTSLGIFFLSYGYIFLLEKTYYNNHDYFILLVSFLLILMGSHRWASVDSSLNSKIKSNVAPNWNILLLRTQVVILYFYGGITKLTKDWMNGDIMRIVLENRAGEFAFKDFFLSDLGIQILSMGGLIFDLIIGFLLCFRPTRLFAIIWAVAFHLMNKWMFNIGVFPYLMIATIVLFLDPQKVRSFLSKFIQQPTQQHTFKSSGITTAFVTIFIILQLLIPLRHHLYSGDVNWTNEANRFSWRMFSNMKRFKANVIVTDQQTKERKEINPRYDIAVKRYLKVMITPDMIVQYAKQLKERFIAQGMTEPVINMEILVSLNGRPYYYFVDPKHDFAQETSKPWQWIMPHPDSGKGHPYR